MRKTLVLNHWGYFKGELITSQGTVGKMEQMTTIEDSILTVLSLIKPFTHVLPLFSNGLGPCEMWHLFLLKITKSVSVI